MKPYVFFFALLLILADACAKVNEQTNPTAGPEIIAYQELEEVSKTLIEVDSGGIGTIYWKPAENINVFYGTLSTMYTSKNTENATVASFKTTDIIGSTEEASTNIWGLYPYDDDATCNGSKISTTIASTQYAVPETFDDNLFATIAHSETRELRFYNVCGGIKFSLSRSDISKITLKGNNNETLAGKVDISFVDCAPVATSVESATTITLTPKTGSTFSKGVNYYFVTLPVSMTCGFTMTFETETEIGTFNYTEKAVTILRSKFGKKANIDTYASFVRKIIATDLSSSGTANCYIVSEGGTYKFKTVQGNSTTSVGEVKGVKVLWETFGTDVTPSEGDLIKADVSFADNYITFNTNDVYKKGNAVIAAYSDAGCTDGNVLWSWHIWLTDQPSVHVYNNGAGTMMDRNLGATSATPGDVHALGLLYQWGRKDPFLSCYQILNDDSPNQQAASTLSWPSSVNSDVNCGTIEYALAHPTTFINYNTLNLDWHYTGSSSSNDNTRWRSSYFTKGMYDPCPAGWRVPDGGSGGVWSSAFGRSDWWTSGFYWDSKNKGVDFGKTERSLGKGTIWYPSAGYISSGNSSLYSVGSGGSFWSSTTTGNNSYCLNINYTGLVNPSTFASRASGFSVRCLSE